MWDFIINTKSLTHLLSETLTRLLLTYRITITVYYSSGMWVLEVLLVLVLDKGSVALNQVLWLKRRS